MTRRTFGRSSESHHPDQQHLDEILRQILVDESLQPDESVSGADAAVVSTPATSAAAVNGAAVRTAAVSRPMRRGRLILPDTLPSEDVLMDVPESERIGPDGNPLPQIRVRFVTKLDYFHAWFRRLRFIYPIYASPFGNDQRISATPVPCIVPKRRFHGQFLLRPALVGCGCVRRTDWCSTWPTAMPPLQSARLPCLARRWPCSLRNWP